MFRKNLSEPLIPNQNRRTAMSPHNLSRTASAESIDELAQSITDVLTPAYIANMIRDMRLTPSEIERLLHDKKRLQGQMCFALSGSLQKLSGVNLSMDRRFSTPDPVGLIRPGLTKM